MYEITGIDELRFEVHTPDGVTMSGRLYDGPATGPRWEVGDVNGIAEGDTDNVNTPAVESAVAFAGLLSDMAALLGRFNAR